jgi:hypothetical protein
VSSFCHEEAAEAVKRRAVEVDWPSVAGGEAMRGWSRASSSTEPKLLGRHSLDTANRSSVAFSSRRVSFALNLLATVEAVGGSGSSARGLAYAAEYIG